MSANANRVNAWKYFYPEGNGKAKSGYHLHHKDETLRHNDLERYNEWRIEDLVMMTESEHHSLHSSNQDEEWRRKNSEGHKGRHMSEEAKRKIGAFHAGKQLSEEHRKKLSEARKGKPSKMKGKHFSEEARKHMSEAHSTEEYKKKFSDARKGHVVTEETKRKISEGRRLYESRRQSILC